MLKDKIVELQNGVNYYVLEEVMYENKKYLLTVKCNLKTEEIKEEDYYVMELQLDGNEFNIKTIQDDNIAAIVTKMLIEKVRNT